jgi:CRISPR/Cas system CMR-associated protein Cmr1 (group 7 of RAMP superfamily)
MDNNKTVKKVSETKPKGIRKIGRPKLRWEEDVIQDIKTGSEELEEKESWQKLLRKTRAHVGLSSS